MMEVWVVSAAEYVRLMYRSMGVTSRPVRVRRTPDTFTHCGRDWVCVCVCGWLED